ncbi:sensor histidine kinase [Paenibacillus paridis]|uniref:sensor histidine kinase n=1 Tax=Paenibacillus paridis TaxID=2583376 RepID=UPI00111F2D23|nr:HAMP domain-containing sensor histidine kinase [Paenibacillus paridis]
MKRNGLIGRAKEKRWLAAITVLAGMVTFLGMQWLVADANQVEQRASQLFWNGYAKLFYESTGSWSGLGERLRTDRFMLSENNVASVTVYDKDGRTVAELKNQGPREAAARKIAVLSDNVIVGFTQIHAAKQKVGSKELLLPLAVMLLVYLLGAWLLRQRKVIAEQAEDRIALAIWQRSAPVKSKNVESKVKLSEALSLIEELAQRAERLETVRRTMVADIAHELRTPIAVMRTQLDNAIQEGQPLPLSKIVSLHDETLRLTKLVRDLQELSLAESGHLPLNKHWFSLTRLAESVVEALVVGTEEQEMKFIMEKDQDIRIYADEARVRQIMINLVGNALQHAHQELCVAILLEDGQALLSIADDGVGIEEEELAFVFDRFYRGSSKVRTSKRAAGLGLGLAIAQQFANVHGGTITVSSEYGNGATFALRLPIMKD